MYNNETVSYEFVGETSFLNKYVVESTEATNMKFTCKVCHNNFKTLEDIKHHITSIHEIGKRKRDNNESTSILYSKKPLLMTTNDEVDDLAETDAFCRNLLGDISVSNEATFIDMSFVNENALLHSTLNGEVSNSVEGENDVLSLRAKVMSLEIALKNKDTIIDEKVNELEVANTEINDYNAKICLQRRSRSCFGKN